MEKTGDNRASQFLIQKIAIDFQWGNAASVIVTALGGVYFSTHCMLIDVDLQVMT